MRTFLLEAGLRHARAEYHLSPLPGISLVPSLFRCIRANSPWYSDS